MTAPNPADLLATARRTLLDAVVPRLDGPARFEALMAANAIAIALRATPEALAHLAETEAALGPPVALAADIRSGGYDPGTSGRARLHEALLAAVQARCRISAPKALENP